MFLFEEIVCFGFLMEILGIILGFKVVWLGCIFGGRCIWEVDGCFYRLLLFVNDLFFLLIFIVEVCFCWFLEFDGYILLLVILFVWLFLFNCEVGGCFYGLLVRLLWILRLILIEGVVVLVLLVWLLFFVGDVVIIVLFLILLRLILLEYRCGIFFLGIFIICFFMRVVFVVIVCFMEDLVFMFCFCGKFVFVWDLINVFFVFV